MQLIIDTSVSEIAVALGVSTEVVVLLAIILVLWTLAWKGVALWHAARGHQKGWFITLLVLNTLGGLEIIYYFFFRKK